MSLQSFTHRDDGSEDSPGVKSDWNSWVSASKTRNFLNNDPLLDWLDLWGKEKGFTPDTKLPGFDSRTDFREFVFAKGRAFEAAAMEFLHDRFEVAEIAVEPKDARNFEFVKRTWEAMNSGAKILSQAVLWNPQNQTYGLPDLLVRSDVLNELFPNTLTAEESSTPAPDIPGSSWHYRVIDIKFSTLDLMTSGHAGSSKKAYMAQVWLYNEPLGRIQGFTAPSGYLLGRAWRQGKNSRGSSAMERLARVDYAHEFRGGVFLDDLTREAVEWVRRVRGSGASWQVTPQPSVDELRPNLRQTNDAPWHDAKRRIAAALKDLTTIPRVTPDKRALALEQGVSEWTDPRCCASLFSIPGSYATQVDAVIESNQSAEDAKTVLPKRINVSEELWRRPAAAEFYVDFETVSDLDDDFSSFPEKGGTPMIFMVGMGWLTDPSDPESWQFKVYTADRLDHAEEKRIIAEWLADMEAACHERNSSLEDARIYHWSPAETSTLSTAYNAASGRHGFPEWDALPWVDLLKHVIKAQPVTVKGSWNFGLKSFSKALHRAGLIRTSWDDGPADGLGAMVGAWWCESEAEKRGGSLRELELMKEIERYNEVDCRVMAEILHYLRSKQ